MKEKKGKIGNIICAVIILILLISSIFLFSQKSKNKVTFIFDKAIVLIVSQSMEPKIETKSYILIEKVDPKDVKVGDIITFYSDDPQILGQLNTHSVKEIVGDNQEFITKGLNNPVEDKVTAKADKIVGVYRKNLPVLTAVLRFFLSKAGLAVMILLFVSLTAFLVAPEFVAYFKGKGKEEDAEKEAEIERRVQEEIEKLKNKNKGSDQGDSDV